MKKRGCVVDVFLGRFGAALRCQMIDFGSPNHTNITKMASKIDPKSKKNRGCVADASLERFGTALGRFLGGHPQKFGNYFRTIVVNESKNGIQKSMPKKHRRMMEKNIENDG